MAAADTTERAHAERAPRKMFMPYDPAGTTRAEQPPAELAHLTGDALFKALTDFKTFTREAGRPPDVWYSRRAVAETGRSIGRFRVWMANYYKTVRGVDPTSIDDRIMVAPDGYDQRSPWWYETTYRKWAEQEGLMDRAGRMVPHVPSGRPEGSKDAVPRRRVAPKQARAAVILAACEALVAAGAPLAKAKAKVAASEGMSVKAVSRWMTAGRKLRADSIERMVRPLMTEAELERVAVSAYQLVKADGRRKHDEHTRAEVARRLKMDRALVDAAVDRHLGLPAAAPEPERPRNYEGEQLRAQMEAAILVDSIALGTAPLHPGT